jgi:hypothetical protein
LSLFEPFPDTEHLVSSVLRDEVTALGGRVHSSLPGKAVYPLAVVQRIGGVPAERHRLDTARIQVDVYGTSQSEAFSIAQEARAAIHGMEATGFTDPVDAWVSAVRDDLGVTRLPDPLSGRDRYTFGVAIYVKPVVPSGS